MTRFGDTLMTEQSGPKQIVSYGIQAEDRGFDFAVSSDHFSPWLTEQGHAGNAWTMLGAGAHATERMELMTYVMCQTIRYRPAVVAQQAATLQMLAEGRFTLGLGAGENLNEHVIGVGWPPVAQRQDMLEDAVHIIRALHIGELVTWGGEHFRVDSARIWGVPDDGVPIGIAVSGEHSIERFAPLGDHLIATDPVPELLQGWDAAKDDPTSRKIGQIPICWAPSKDQAVDIAREQFRWFVGGRGVNADLPTSKGFHDASQFVRTGDVAASIACGPDLDELVDRILLLWEAGFTDVVLVQVGDELQRRFLDDVAEPLLEKLRVAAPRD